MIFRVDIENEKASVHSLGQEIANLKIKICVSYGNMGYGKFKGGTKNQKGFVPNMTIFQEKKSYLEKWISMD